MLTPKWFISSAQKKQFIGMMLLKFGKCQIHL